MTDALLSQFPRDLCRLSQDISIKAIAAPPTANPIVLNPKVFLPNDKSEIPLN